MTRTKVELVHEGKYAAEVSVELIEEEDGWSPIFLSAMQGNSTRSD
jgi:hypothetical protein